MLRKIKVLYRNIILWVHSIEPIIIAGTEHIRYQTYLYYMYIEHFKIVTMNDFDI